MEMAEKLISVVDISPIESAETAVRVQIVKSKYA